MSSCKNQTCFPNVKALHYPAVAYILGSFFAFGPIVALALLVTGFLRFKTVSESSRPERSFNNVKGLPAPATVEQPTPQPTLTLKDDSSKIIISVDATPSRGGAIFRIPEANAIYYYSINWTAQWEFPSECQESDKFEMANTLIALDVFSKQIKAECNHSPIVLQTDHTFALTIKPRNNSNTPGQQLLKNIILVLESLGVPYDIRHVTRSNDLDMKGADLLSRGRIHDYRLFYHTRYTKVDLSDTALRSLITMSCFVPKEYVK